MIPTRDELLSAKATFAEQGYCRLDRRLSESWLRRVRASAERIGAQRRPEVVYERNGEDEDTATVRALHGCHLYDETFDRLVRLPQLVDCAEALVGAPVYVYQFKINMKPPREGGAWPWHQDFPFWFHEDGMRRPDAVNLAVFLDAVDEHNGPLTVLSGSHRLGIVETERKPRIGDHDWRQDVSADLTYTIAPARAAELAADYPPRTITGPRGCVMAFHPGIVHSSSSNLSDNGRAILYVTYNSVDNAVLSSKRPNFLVSTDARPVVKLDSAEE